MHAAAIILSLLAGTGLVVLLGSAPTCAETLTSTSYRHVGGSPVASSAASANALTSTAASPSIGSFEVSVGEAPSVSPSGSSSDLASVHPGFWARFLGKTVGGYSSLDLDADLRPFFLDLDDDGDGLDDLVETATEMFVSSLNTGSNPFLPDSDGDGFNDGVEVLAGSDPNDETSRPAIHVPSAGTISAMLMVVMLVVVGLRTFRMRRGEVQC